MSAAGFRRMVMSFPDVLESAHHGHPDFRARGRIFATLAPPDRGAWAMVKLTPRQQGEFVKAFPLVFTLFPGAWGRNGSTRVNLDAVSPASRAAVRAAAVAAWTNVAEAMVGRPRSRRRAAKDPP